MKAALTAAFSPEMLEIDDESHLHHGHAGAAPGGETHFAVRIKTPVFAGLSRVARHRAINEALAAEFATGLHALSLQADWLKDEAGRRSIRSICQAHDPDWMLSKWPVWLGGWGLAVRLGGEAWRLPVSLTRANGPEINKATS